MGRKVTSKRDAQKASTVLRDKRTGKDSNSAAGSDFVPKREAKWP